MTKLRWIVPMLLIVLASLAGGSGLALHKTHAANGDTAQLNPGVVGATVYLIDKQTAAFRTGITTTADVMSGATVRATTVLRPCTPKTLSSVRQTVYITGHFSNAAQSATIELWGYYSPDEGTTFIGPSRQTRTITAGAAQDDTGKWLSLSVPFDSTGANFIYLPVAVAPGAGTLDLYVGTE